MNTNQPIIRRDMEFLQYFFTYRISYAENQYSINIVRLIAIILKLLQTEKLSLPFPLFMITYFFLNDQAKCKEKGWEGGRKVL